MEHLYTVGMQSKDLAEINETLRSMSIASMALTRLINVQEDNYSFAVPDAKRKHYQSPTDRATFSALARLLSAPISSPNHSFPNRTKNDPQAKSLLDSFFCFPFYSKTNPTILEFLCK